MKASESKDSESLITQALEAALVCGRPIRLVADRKSGSTGLFPDETGERRKAIERCLDGIHPLLRVVATEVSSSTPSATHRFVTITSDGIKHLFSSLPLDRSSDLLQSAILDAVKEVRGIDESMRSLVSARQQVAESVAELLQCFQNAAMDEVSLRLQIAEKYDLLYTWLETLPIPPTLGVGSRVRQPLREPTTETERQFRQRAAQELVFAWQDTDIAARDALERALFNLGAERIGQRGDQTEFSGRLHATEDAAFPGDIVVVEQPGWLLTDGQGAYLLLAAKVALVSQSGE